MDRIALVEIGVWSFSRRPKYGLFVSNGRIAYAIDGCQKIGTLAEARKTAKRLRRKWCGRTEGKQKNLEALFGVPQDGDMQELALLVIRNQLNALAAEAT